MRWRNYSQTLFKKTKIEHSSGYLASSFRVCFIAYQIESYQNILTLSCRPLTFNSYKAFFKNKNRSGTSLAASFSA